MLTLRDLYEAQIFDGNVTVRRWSDELNDYSVNETFEFPCGSMAWKLDKIDETIMDSEVKYVYPLVEPLSVVFEI